MNVGWELRQGFVGLSRLSFSLPPPSDTSCLRRKLITELIHAGSLLPCLKKIYPYLATSYTMLELEELLGIIWPYPFIHHLTLEERESQGEVFCVKLHDY